MLLILAKKKVFFNFLGFALLSQATYVSLFREVIKSIVLSVFAFKQKSKFNSWYNNHAVVICIVKYGYGH